MIAAILALLVLCMLYMGAVGGRVGHPGLTALQGWSYAHRGLHAEGRPENSMAAFRAALDRGFGIPKDITVWVLQVALFLLGLWLVGKTFAATTLIGSFAYPLLFSLFTRLQARTGPLTDDPLLCMVFAGLTFGIGIGLVLRQGGSTGGTDIVAVILNKKLGLPVSGTLYAVDAVVLVTQLFFVDSAEQVLYGILFVLCYSVLVDVVLTSGKSRIQLQIISPQYETINHMILRQFDRGSTLYRTEGGFSRRESYAVQTIIGKRELFRLREAVLTIDQDAFIVISQVSEVNGRGFTLEKIAE